MIPLSVISNLRVFPYRQSNPRDPQTTNILLIFTWYS